MTDPALIKWADTLLTYCLNFSPQRLGDGVGERRGGEQVMIRADEHAIPLAREVYAAALRAGTHPYLQVSLDDTEETFLQTASSDQLDFISPIRKVEYETIDAMIALVAPANTASLAGVDPARQARYRRAVETYRKRFFERTAEGKADWVLTLYPTDGAAQNAGMSLRDYTRFVYSAMYLDQDDPAAAWRARSAVQQTYVDHLDRVDTLRFVADGTDLTLRVTGRKWINGDGHKNFPCGEVFTGPIEDSANGHVRFSFPAAHLGHEADGVRLRFQDGKVVDASADHGQSFLDAMLATDDGARFLGEVAVGCNYGVTQYTKNTLYDEKIGGTFHLAVGRSYAETGAVNQSALHWDMVCDMRPEAGGGAIYADGALIHENGQWKL